MLIITKESVLTKFKFEISQCILIIVPETVTCDSASWQSTTTPAKPMTHDKIYYFLPYWDNKPCMHIRSVWADLRRRMYNSNVIAKLAEKYVSKDNPFI